MCISVDYIVKSLEWIFNELGINTRNWIDLSHDRDYWRALLNAALNVFARWEDVVYKRNLTRIDDLILHACNGSGRRAEDMGLSLDSS